MMWPTIELAYLWATCSFGTLRCGCLHTQVKFCRQHRLRQRVPFLSSRTRELDFNIAFSSNTLLDIDFFSLATKLVCYLFFIVTYKLLKTIHKVLCIPVNFVLTGLTRLNWCIMGYSSLCQLLIKFTKYLIFFYTFVIKKCSSIFRLKYKISRYLRFHKIWSIYCWQRTNRG